MAKSKKEKLIRLEGYDDLDGMLVPESWFPKYDDWGNGFFVKDNVLMEYKSEEQDVIIPEGITKINKGVFSGKTIHSITIPKSLTSISTESFTYCYSFFTINVVENHPVFHVKDNCLIDTENKTIVMGLNNAFIPADGSVVKIGKDAFHVNGWGCKGNNIIPNTIKEIAPYAFAGCGVQSVVIPSSVKKIGKGAFASCDYLQKVVIEAEISKIEDDVFSGCLFLKSVKIPESVTKIGKKSFYRCEKLEEINFPENLTEIGLAAFYWSNNWYKSFGGHIHITKKLKLANGSFPCEGVESITLDEENPYYYCQDNCLIEKETKTLVFGCKNSKIPNDIKKIGKLAFYFCKGLKSLVIPDSVEEIGNEAFEFCSDLTSVVIPKSVKEIGQSAFVCRDVFWEPFKLKNVTIPKQFEDRTNIFDEGNKINFKYI